MKIVYKFIILILVISLWLMSIISYKNIGEDSYEVFMVAFGTISFVSLCCLFVRYPLILGIKHIKNPNFKEFLLRISKFFSKEHLFFSLIAITALIEHNLFYFIYHGSNLAISIPCIIGYIAIGLFITNIVLGELLAAKKNIKHLFKIHIYVAIGAILFMITHVLLMID